MSGYCLTYWHDGEECEPPEPGKGWIAICETDDDGFAGEEIAIIVNRTMDDQAACDRKVKQAEMIVEALNFYWNINGES